MALLSALMLAPSVANANFSFSLPLTTGSANALDLGAFAAGTSLTLSLSGNGDLVNSTFQTNPDGSLFVPAQSPYTFANPGQPYSTVNGGDGINHFVGGGANYDSTGSGYGFAGLQSTDTTNPADIRLGAVVGTFSATPTRSSWFLIGYGTTIVIPTGGTSLYVAVNDSYNPDNHGTYSGLVQINAAVPEPSSLALCGIAGLVGLGWTWRRKRTRVRLIRSYSPGVRRGA